MRVHPLLVPPLFNLSPCPCLLSCSPSSLPSPAFPLSFFLLCQNSPFLSPEFPQISLSFFTSLPLHFLKFRYTLVPLDTTVHFGIFLLTLIHSCTLLYTPVHSRTLSYTLVHSRTLLYTLVQCTFLFTIVPMYPPLHPYLPFPLFLAGIKRVPSSSSFPPFPFRGSQSSFDWPLRCHLISIPTFLPILPRH